MNVYDFGYLFGPIITLVIIFYIIKSYKKRKENLNKIKEFNKNE